MVQLTDSSLGDYPTLCRMLTAGLEKLHENNKVWLPFCNWSGLPTTFALSAVQVRTTADTFYNPKLVIKALDEGKVLYHGRFRSDEPDQICLCDDIAKQAEVPLNAGNKLYWPIVEATVLHELVHWGDNRVNGTLSSGPERGNQFELAAYNRLVKRFWRADGVSHCDAGDAAARLLLPPNVPAFKLVGNPVAAPGKGGFWPVRTTNNRRHVISYETLAGIQMGDKERAFGADRRNRQTESIADDRHHVGVDLFGEIGDPVIACESGVIVGIQDFYKGTKAMLVENASGIVVNYGEIANKSWGTLRPGSQVAAGQQIARLGRLPSDRAMLHFETYAKGTKLTQRWFWGQPAPKNILNPTSYLLALDAPVNS